jgi:hypothetical protein
VANYPVREELAIQEALLGEIVGGHLGANEHHAAQEKGVNARVEAPDAFPPQDGPHGIHHSFVGVLVPRRQLLHRRLNLHLRLEDEEWAGDQTCEATGAQGEQQVRPRVDFLIGADGYLSRVVNTESVMTLI